MLRRVAAVPQAQPRGSVVRGREPWGCRAQGKERRAGSQPSVWTARRVRAALGAARRTLASWAGVTLAGLTEREALRDAPTPAPKRLTRRRERSRDYGPAFLYKETVKSA